MENLIGLLAVFLIFGGGGLAMRMFEAHNRTKLELARLRLEQSQGYQAEAPAGAIQDELRRLRVEMEQLRETSTQYDLSFDTALQRLETRVNRLEAPTQQTVR